MTVLTFKRFVDRHERLIADLQVGDLRWQKVRQTLSLRDCATHLAIPLGLPRLTFL